MVPMRNTMFFAAMAAGLTYSPAMAQNLDKVVRATGGGAFAEALHEVCDVPFTEATGIVVEPANTDDATAQIRAQMLTGNVTWDVSNTSADAIYVAAENGWLEELDWDQIDPDKKLPDIARHPYGVGINTYSETIVKRTDKEPEGKVVSSWQDFWDVDNFPGGRSLRDTPVKNLEFALIADGVDPDKVYDVLSTQEGVDRAFAKLDELRPSITTWWTSGQQPLQLLASGEVTYATAWNGRVAPLKREGVPVEIVWDGGALIIGYHSILKGAKNIPEAYAWLKWCWTDAERGAELTKRLPYPGFAPGLMDLLPAEMRSELPTYPANMDAQFTFNGKFWADNRTELQRAWERWRLEG